MEQLRHFTASCPETHKLSHRRLVDKATIMGLCRGLISVDDQTNVVRFVRESFMLAYRISLRVYCIDYTAKDVVQGFIHESFPYPHSLLTLVCITLLTEWGFQGPAPNSTRVLDPSIERQPIVAYAYEAWSIHARQSLDDEPTVNRLAHFIQGCRAFPTNINSFSPRYDTLEPLHMMAHFDLPLSLAGATHLDKPNQRTSIGGATPLALAVMRDSLNAVREVLSLPCIQVNAGGPIGTTPLMLALTPTSSDEGGENTSKKIAILLLAHPDINVNALDRFGQSALMQAASRCRLGAATLLLAHRNIDPNLVDPQGYTPLMHAVGAGWGRVARVLLSDPRVKASVKCDIGKTALDIAEEKGLHGIVDLLRARSRRERHYQFWLFMNSLHRAFNFLQSK